jgi:hypothetical protein
MPRWVFNCPLCNCEITYEVIVKDDHSPLTDPFAWLLDKPFLASQGANIDCPNCKNTAIYQRHQMTYRPI